MLELNEGERRTGAKLNPLGASNIGRPLILSLSFGGSSGRAARSSTSSGSSSSYAAENRFLVRVGPTVRIFACVRDARKEVGFLPPAVPKEGTEVGGAETLRAKVAGARTGSAILLVRLGGTNSSSLSSNIGCASVSSVGSASNSSCLRRANNLLRPPSPAYGLLFLLFERVSFSFSFEELIYLLA